jgi:hypothetical protein
VPVRNAVHTSESEIMRTRVSGYGRMHIRRADCRDRVGVIRMQADSEADACLLAAIYRGIFTDEFPGLKRSLRQAAIRVYDKPFSKRAKK